MFIHDIYKILVSNIHFLCVYGHLFLELQEVDLLTIMDFYPTFSIVARVPLH